jgi:hypothetical protein
LSGRTHGELADRGVLGQIESAGHDVGDPVRRNAELRVKAVHRLGRLLVADRVQQLGIDRGGVDRRGADVGSTAEADVPVRDA